MAVGPFGDAETGQSVCGRSSWFQFFVLRCCKDVQFIMHVNRNGNSLAPPSSEVIDLLAHKICLGRKHVSLPRPCTAVRRARVMCEARGAWGVEPAHGAQPQFRNTRRVRVCARARARTGVPSLRRVACAVPWQGSRHTSAATIVVTWADECRRDMCAAARTATM